jgi:hypothetical protein
MKAKDIINGSFLVRKGFLSWVPFIFLAVVLIVIYISNRYSIEATVKEIDQLEQETDYLEKKSAEERGVYQKQTQMLQLEKQLEPQGVKVSREEKKQVILMDKSDTTQKQ